MYNLVKDIEQGLKSYPLLQLSKENNKPIVKGTFIAHKGDLEIETYTVAIGFPLKYPYELPWVVETSNKILPRNATRHIFINDRLCFGNLQDVLRVCRNGITFKWFLDNILNTHLCREYVRDATGIYPTGERSHGEEGIWEGYYDIFKTKDKSKILNELKMILNNTTFAKNKRCFCGSGKLYKRCHENIRLLLFDIGRENVIMIFEMLKSDYEKSFISG